jgi:hypothetical protein
MEKINNEPLTAADILIAEINNDLLNTRIYSEKATAYLEKNDEIFENILVRDIVKVKKINGKRVVRMNSRKTSKNYL